MSQCVQAGLGDGRKLFMDSCLVQANASNNSVVNAGIIPKESFTYDAVTDCFICPAGCGGRPSRNI